jgi:hypothetical protein
MTITDTAVDLLGLAIVGGVAMKILNDDEPRHKHKKRKEDKPFKW